MPVGDPGTDGTAHAVAEVQGVGLVGAEGAGRLPLAHGADTRAM